MSAGASEPNGSATYAAFVEQELIDETRRREKTEAKAQQQATLTGSFLLAAIAVLGVTVDDYTRLHHPVIVACFLTALLCALVAIGLGAFVSGNRPHPATDQSTIDRMATREQWSVDEETALFHLTHQRAQLLAAASKANRRLAGYALAGQWVQIAFFAFFAAGFAALIIRLI
jgi:hypothetical protein